jgi:hypothetical protein
MLSRFLLGALVALSFTLFSCTEDSPAGPGPDTGGTTTSRYNVTYTDNTVYLDSAATARTLIDHDAETRTLTFRTDTALADLAVGSQLLVFRKALGEVTSVTQQGSNVIVATKATTLNKVFEDAEIDWEQTVRFDGNMVPQVVDKKGQAHIMTPVGPDSFAVEIEVGDHTYKIFWKMLGDDAQVDLHVEKKIQEALRARYSLSGTLRKFKTTANIRMDNGELVKFELQNPNVKGNFKMTVNCAGSGNEMVNLELPISLIKVPITVGPLIVVMDVKVQVVVQSVVPHDGSSLIDAEFAYESSAGFSFVGGQIKGLGSAGTYKIEKGSKNQTGASTAVAANFGLGFPRLEFKLFDADVMVPWVQTALLLGGDYAGGIHPCQQAKAQFIGASGVDLKLFGHTLKRNVELWKLERVLLKAGDCP